MVSKGFSNSLPAAGNTRSHEPHKKTVLFFAAPRWFFLYTERN